MTSATPIKRFEQLVEVRGWPTSKIASGRGERYSDNRVQAMWICFEEGINFGKEAAKRIQGELLAALREWEGAHDDESLNPVTMCQCYICEMTRRAIANAQKDK